MTLEEKIPGKVEKSVYSSDLKILSHKCERKNSDLKLTGRAKNITEYPLKYVHLKADFYDKIGDLVGNTHDDVFDLEPNTTWKFNMSEPDGNKITEYKLKIIYG